MNSDATACILTINSGSSSLKFSVYADDLVVLSGQFDRVKTSDCTVKIRLAGASDVIEKNVSENEIISHALCLKWLTKYLQEGHLHINAIGHRVVHGGLKYIDSVVITKEVLHDLEELVAFAPLHQPHNIAGIRACGAQLPGIPQIACFDTAFHRDRPEIDRMYGIDQEIAKEHGIIAYGFHGLSYTHIANKLQELATSHQKVAVCHLGNGSSVCGLVNGKGITSSMGFTALDGLVMGTRSGSIDPGVVLFLVEQFGLEKTTDLLYKKSGLLGISGSSSDVRDLQDSGDNGHRGSVVALEKYSWAVAKEISYMLPNLGGLDAIVFTAGIGERSNRVRESICKKLSWLGVEIDMSENLKNSHTISTPESKIKVYIIPTDEEGIIARDTQKLAFT